MGDDLRAWPEYRREPSTEAGRRLLADCEGGGIPATGSFADHLHLIEAEAYAQGHADGKVPWPSRAEAVAAERERIRSEVERLPGLEITLLYSEPDRISRAAVLDIIDLEDTDATDGGMTASRQGVC